MQIDLISIEELLENIDTQAIKEIPLHQNPFFLSLSATYLRENSHLLIGSDFNEFEINPFFVWVKKTQNETLGFLPVLQVESQNRLLNLIPARKIENALLYKGNLLTTKESTQLNQLLLKEIGEIQYQSAQMGWDLSASLFSIFGWFPEEERKEMVKQPSNINFEEVSFEAGKKELKRFYEKDLEKKKDFAGLFRRNIDFFHDSFSENYRLFFIRQDHQLIGVTSLIDYSDKIYQMEFLGSLTFQKLYSKILFLLFKLLKKEKKKALYPAFFEWCLIPFLSEMIKKGKVDMSFFLKKANQTKARKIMELDE